jgi:alpha-L-fucosidase
VIDLGETLTLKGFTYRPRMGQNNGNVVGYEVYVSGDGQVWGEAAAKGEFGNIRNNPVEQRVRFGAEKEGRYLKFVALSEVQGRPWASAAEIGVMTR